MYEGACVVQGLLPKRCGVLQVATKVDEGVKQLVKAEQIQKSSRTVICIMFLLVAVIVMVIIVLFKLIVF